MKIDALTDADVAAAVEIDVAAFPPGELGNTADDPRKSRERTLREELARPWAHLRAARGANDEVVGYILFWRVVDELHLLNVAVATREQRRGIGRALVAHLIEHARESGASRILLEVRASNRAAIALYASVGFVEFNVRRRYYGDGEDALEMELAGF